MTFSSDEVNLLIYRYLLESGETIPCIVVSDLNKFGLPGFVHSAFLFFHESQIFKSNINGFVLPPFSILTIIEKGIKYTEAEIMVGDDDSDYELTERLSLLEAVTPSIVEDYQNVLKEEKEDSINKGKNIDEVPIAENFMVTQRNGFKILKGHKKSVYSCSFNPKRDLLATGSEDSTARMWDMSDSNSVTQHFFLPNFINNVWSNKRLTSLGWNYDGSLLATGSDDCCTRIWNTEGCLLHTFDQHTGPVHALKWSKSGSYICTGGVDKTVVVCNAATGKLVQKFSLHTEPVMDVDWQSNNVFASTDKKIHVCQLGSVEPIKTFSEHTSEVNSIKWDPQGKLLASCSDDMKLKIWSMNSENSLISFEEHTREIFTLKWSPTGPGSANPNMNLVLASGSYDTTVKLWSIERQTSIHTFSDHKGSVYAIAFSPDGRFLVSGGADKLVHIYSTQSPELVHSFIGSGTIFDVCWNSGGDKIGASSGDGRAFVLDMRNL